MEEVTRIDAEDLYEMPLINQPLGAALVGLPPYSRKFTGHHHRYTEEAKRFILTRARNDGVRATARSYGIERRTLQRWARQYGVTFPRCPAWVIPWAEKRSRGRGLH